MWNFRVSWGVALERLPFPERAMLSMPVVPVPALSGRNDARRHVTTGGE